MKYKLLLTLIIASVSLFAQEEKKRMIYLGADVGFISSDIETPDYKFIRSSISSNRIGQENITLDIQHNSWKAGINAEIRSKNQKLSLWIGASYKFEIGNLNMNNENNNVNFFYLTLNQINTRTDYAKVRSIQRTNSYLNIPVAFQFTFLKGYFFQPYLAVMGDFNFKVNTIDKVEFEKEKMEPNADLVMSKFKEASSMYSSISLVHGVKLGNYKKPHFKIEVMLPIAFSQREYMGLYSLDNLGSGGMRIAFVYPINYSL